jgi:hypothetical protein
MAHASSCTTASLARRSLELYGTSRRISLFLRRSLDSRNPQNLSSFAQGVPQGREGENAKGIK